MPVQRMKVVSVKYIYLLQNLIVAIATSHKWLQKECQIYNPCP